MNALWDYIVRTGRYELLVTIKEFMPLDNFTAVINNPDNNGEYLLINAIKNKNLPLLRAILDVPNVNVNICHQEHNALWHARNLETDMATRIAIVQMLQQAGVTEEEACTIQ